jgi:hypothetical protein
MAMRPYAHIAWQVNAGQIRNSPTLVYSIYQEREDNFSFALNSHVRAQIAQRALGEDTVTCPAEDNGSVRQASATRDDLPDWGKHELGL